MAKMVWISDTAYDKARLEAFEKHKSIGAVVSEAIEKKKATQ